MWAAARVAVEAAGSEMIPRVRELLHELRRRRVFRVAGVYLVVGWVVIQAADVLVPQLLLPDWVARAIILQ